MSYLPNPFFIPVVLPSGSQEWFLENILVKVQITLERQLSVINYIQTKEGVPHRYVNNYRVCLSVADMDPGSGAILTSRSGIRDG